MRKRPSTPWWMLGIVLVVAGSWGADSDAATKRKRKPRPPKRPPPEQRHFDISSSVWSGKVDAGEVLQGTLALRVDAMASAVRGGITGRDGNGLLQCSGTGTLRAGTLTLRCQGDTLSGALTGRLHAAQATLRFEGQVRARPIDGEIDVVRGRIKR